MSTKKLLTIIEQPSHKFWKDEGGKNSYLYVTLKYNGNSTINIPLIASLYYEGGLKVEQGNANILSLNNCENKKFQYNISNKCKKVGFRIDKVSRRLDNRKLFVKFEVDKENKHVNKSLKEINSINTIPITVLSKRKIPAKLRKLPAELRKLHPENPKNKKRKIYPTLSDIKENSDKLKEDLKEEMNKLKEDLKEELKEEMNKVLIKEIVELKKSLLKEKKNNIVGESLVVHNFYGENSINTSFIDIKKTEDHVPPLEFYMSDKECHIQSDLTNEVFMSDLTNEVFMSDINPIFN